VAIGRKAGFDVFNVRLLIGLDKLLREKRRYQGDLSASINDALLAVNLNIVKLVTLQGKKPKTARETQVVILRRLIRRIQRIADARGCSMNQLANSGLFRAYLAIPSSSRPTRQPQKLTYDKMIAEKRQRLMEAIGSLSGLQEGPKDAFSDGTHYEYDADLKTTVEVGPSRSAFPVALVAGKLQHDLEKRVTSRTTR
jgi:hypothetical protein